MVTEQGSILKTNILLYMQSESHCLHTQHRNLYDRTNLRRKSFDLNQYRQRIMVRALMSQGMINSPTGEFNKVSHLISHYTNNSIQQEN